MLSEWDVVAEDGPGRRRGGAPGVGGAKVTPDFPTGTKLPGPGGPVLARFKVRYLTPTRTLLFFSYYYSVAKERRTDVATKGGNHAAEGLDFSLMVVPSRSDSAASRQYCTSTPTAA